MVKKQENRYLKRKKKLPDAVIACVGGGSNAMGIFSGFVDDKDVELIGVEGGGEGVETEAAATLSKGTEEILHGSLSFVLQDNDGQISRHIQYLQVWTILVWDRNTHTSR